MEETQERLSLVNSPTEIPAFKTPSGKLELACQAIGQKGAVTDDLLFLPHYAPLMPSGGTSEYPLLLIAYKSPFIATGYLANPPFMNKLIPDYILKGDENFVDLNPQTAKSLGLDSGDKVSLKTTQGEATVLINVSANVAPGVVLMPKGLGHKAYDEYIQNKGANANSLIEVQLDPVTGMGNCLGYSRSTASRVRG